MKQIMCVLAACAAAVVTAGTLAEFNFKLPADQAFTDQSGNSYNPVNAVVAKSLTADGFKAADAKGIRIPAVAFPGAKGRIETVLRGDSKELGMLFIAYGKGDVLNITSQRNRIRVRLMDRSEKKWYNVPPSAVIPADKFVKVVIQWELPGKISVSVDGKKVELPVAVEGSFAQGNAVYIGANQRGELPYLGTIQSFKLEDMQ